MRKLFSTLVLSVGFVVMSASVVHAQEVQVPLVFDCSDPGIVDKVVGLMTLDPDDSVAHEAILREASMACPALATEFGVAAMAALPQQTALFAGIMIELDPAAAGMMIGLAPAAAGPGGFLGAGVAGNIPSPPGGGGVASPN